MCMFLLLTHILLITYGSQCAPKLGSILVEQLKFEAFVDDKNNNNANYIIKRAFSVPAYYKIKNTTSFYAKMTQNPVKFSPIFELKNKNHKLLEQTSTTKSAYVVTTKRSAVSEFTTQNNSGSISNLLKLLSTKSPTSTVKANISSHLILDRYDNSQTNKSEEQIMTKNEMAKKKANVRHARSETRNNRRNGAVLQSDGYVFNDNNCQMRGDRVICGYNNEGLITTETGLVQDDCILRGDRVECGYVKRRADTNRRNNKQKSAQETTAKVINVTSSMTKGAIASFYTKTTSADIPESINTNEMTTTRPAINVTIVQKPLVFEAELITGVEQSIASLMSNANTTSTDTDTFKNTKNTSMSNKITQEKAQIESSQLPIFELIKRVEKLLKSTVTNTTFIPFSALTSEHNTPIPAIETKPSKVLDLINRVRKVTATTSNFSSSTVTVMNLSTKRTVNSTSTMSTTISTSSATTSSPNNTNISTTPLYEYIDEGEYCIEKDGRLVCYDNPSNMEKIDDEEFLEK